MPTKYTIRQGDSIVDVAYRNGRFWLLLSLTAAACSAAPAIPAPAIPAPAIPVPPPPTPPLQRAPADVSAEPSPPPALLDVSLTIGGHPIEHMLPSEQRILTPVPIYIEPPPGVDIQEAKLSYRPYGGNRYKHVILKKVHRGFGTEIPCVDLTSTGVLRYFITLTGSDGQPLEHLGSTKEPLRVEIKNEIDGGPPAIPGEKPPQRCKVMASSAGMAPFSPRLLH
jgi:hypothetical protein